MMTTTVTLGMARQLLRELLHVELSEKALKLHGLWPERYDQAAEPVNETRFLELLRAAGTYVSY